MAFATQGCCVCWRTDGLTQAAEPRGYRMPVCAMVASIDQYATLPGLPSPEPQRMNLQLSLAPLIALLAGILILVRPRLLNYIVAIYLIVIGVLGLLGHGGRML